MPWTIPNAMDIRGARADRRGPTPGTRRRVLDGIFLVGLTFLAICLLLDTASAEWRSYDGSNNNPKNPKWGAADSFYIRQRSGKGFGDVVPEYADGISAPYPEVAIFNSTSNTSYFQVDPGTIALPSPRFLSNALFKWGANTTLAARPVENGADPSNVKRSLSELVTYWGHYISNDISKGASTAEPRPIAIPTCDDTYDPLCTGTANPMPFRRFSFSNATDNTTQPRIHFNTISAFLDNTPVYGYKWSEASVLRANRSGLLQSHYENITLLNGSVYEAEFLALAGEVKGSFASYAVPRMGIGKPDNLFAMGAAMGFNGAPTTWAITTLLHREHNRLARKFAAEHPDWDDERLFQTARNWVNAFLQHITYFEYLPVLLGSNALSEYNGYKVDVDPSAQCLFGAVTLRYGHSEMTDTITLAGTPVNPSWKQIMLRQPMFLPLQMAKQYDITSILMGAATSVQRDVDIYYSESIRTYVWDLPNRGGRDQASLDIARARDMGCWNYLNAKIELGLWNGTAEQLIARGFAGITSDPALQKRMEQAYGGRIELVDALVGGLAEDHVNGGNLGPLFFTSAVKQFENLRDGDRFWYQNKEVTGFTDAELAEIRNTSLRTILLRNTNLDPLLVPMNLWQVSTGWADDNSALNSRYTNFLRLSDDYTINWRINGKNLAVAQQLAGKGWAGLGFADSPSSYMVGADFVIAYKPTPDGEYEVKHFRANPKGFDRPIEAEDSTIVVKAITPTASGGMIFEWERPMNTGNPEDHVIVAGVKSNMIFAFDPSQPILAFHGGNRGSFQADMTSTDTNSVSVVSSSSVVTGTRTFHGLGMIAVFGLVYPTAIYVARFTRHTDYWLDFHTKAQSLGGVSFVALGTAAAATVSAIGQSAHAIIGILVFSLVCVQVIIGIGAIFGLSQHFKGYLGVKYAHRLVGYLIIIFGWVNIHLGLNKQWPSTAWIGDLVVGIWQALFLTLFILTELGWYGIIPFPMPDQWISPIAKKIKKWFAGLFGKDEDDEEEEVLTKAQAEEALLTYTWDDINARVSQGDMWMVIDGLIYDISEWIGAHPGGRQALEKLVGMDATYEFYGGLPPPSASTEGTGTLPRGASNGSLGGLDGGVSSAFGSTLTRSNTRRRRPRRNEDIAAANAPALGGTGPLHDHSVFAQNKLRSLLVGKLASGSVNHKDDMLKAAPSNHLRQEFRRFQLTHVTNVSEAAAATGVGEGEERPTRRFLFVPVVSREEDPDDFIPGEHVEVRARVKKTKMVVRTYTPIAGSLRNGFEISVKIYPRGQFTSWLEKNAVPGKLTLEVRGPLGTNLLCPARPDGCWDRVMMIAGGTGVTPCLQMIQWTIAKIREGSRPPGKLQPSIYLVYINRNEREVLEYPFLDHLADEHPDTLEVQYEYGKLEPHSLMDGLGYLDAPPVEGLERKVIICGPPDFCEYARKSLNVLNVKEDMILAL